MPRGGARSGSPARAYQNRTDLHQPVRVAPGEPYGQNKQLAQAQKQIPLPTQNQPQTAPPQGAPGGPVQQGPPPDQPALAGQNDFTRPTDRPTEPVTTGLPVGAGQGPEALQSPAGQPDVIGAQLRALYQQAPNNDLLRLIELHDNGY